MPSTHTSLHYHLIFSTKERLPIVGAQWRDRLHAYIGGICEGNGWCATSDGRNERSCPSACRVKVFASAGLFLARCESGFFSVGASRKWKEIIRLAKRIRSLFGKPIRDRRRQAYVLNQEEHHKQKTFQQESIELLEAGGIEYDERYLW